MAKKIFKHKYRGHTVEWDEDSQGKLLETIFIEVSQENNKSEYSSLKELREDENAVSPAKLKNGQVYEKKDDKWVKIS